jgi:TatD DNase family protein
MLIDTHCHLDSKNFPDGADDPIARGLADGVSAFVCIGVGSMKRAEETLALAERSPHVVATVGVHPHEAAELTETDFVRYQEMARSQLVVAVGEVGLDYHYDHSPRERQQAVFRRFIALAKELNKPLVIHTRSAPADTLQILDEEGARDVGGVIHCFSEDVPFARRALELGFDLSFSGLLTFKTATGIQEVAAWAPAERILVETDSPYLAPVPLRGKKNEPAWVVHTATKLAELRGLALDAVGELTTRNAVARFGPRLAEALAHAPQRLAAQPH